MNFDSHQVYSKNSSEPSEAPISHASPETYRLSIGVPLSAHLKFPHSKCSPFDAKAQAHIVLGTRAISDAFAAIESEIAEGASRVCMNGCPGMGKTSLARALPKLLGDKARIALVPDPALSGESSRTTLPLVTVIDPAQKADENSLDHLDGILSYRSDLPPSCSRACPSHDSASKLKATRLTKVTNFSSGGSIESKHSNLNSPRFRETAFRPTPTSTSSARYAKRRNSSAPMQLWPFTRIRVAYLVKALRPAKAC